jgi:hypothetical protein
MFLLLVLQNAVLSYGKNEKPGTAEPIATE